MPARAVRIAFDEVRCRHRPDPPTGLPRSVGETGRDPVEELAQVGPFPAQRQRALLGARQEQQIVRQPLTDEPSRRVPNGSRACSSSAVRGRRSASSSSVRSRATGVRSSWLASATNRRSCSRAACSLVSMWFSVTARREISSPAGETGKESGRGRSDALGAPAHHLDRTQRRRGEQISGQGCEQDDEGADDEQLTEDPVERLPPGGERARDDDRPARGQRLGQDAPFPFRLPQRGGAQERRALSAQHGVATVEERRQPRLGGLDRTSCRVDHLSKRHSARRVGIDEPVLVVRVRDRLVRLRSERLVDRGHQGTADAHVDEHGHRSDHAHHRGGERNRQPHANRDRAHSATLRR